MGPKYSVPPVAQGHRMIPLPGRPCRVRWLEPLPNGWSVRSDGLFFFFVHVGSLYAMGDVFAPRNTTRETLAMAVETMQRMSQQDPDETTEAQAQYRLSAFIVSRLHRVKESVVMGALAQACAATLAQTGHPAAFPAFAEEVLRRYAQLTGGQVIAVGPDGTQRPRPPLPPRPRH